MIVIEVAQIFHLIPSDGILPLTIVRLDFVHVLPIIEDTLEPIEIRIVQERVHGSDELLKEVEIPIEDFTDSVNTNSIRESLPEISWHLKNK